MVSSEHVVLDGDIAELSGAIETFYVAGRADVDAPVVVEQLVAADEYVAHEVVSVESSSGVAVGEIVQYADVTGTLYADAVIATVLYDIASDDLSLALRHWCASVCSVSKA